MHAFGPRVAANMRSHRGRTLERGRAVEEDKAAARVCDLGPKEEVVVGDEEEEDRYRQICCQLKDHTCPQAT